MQSSEMRQHLRGMFAAAREFLLSEGLSKLGVLRHNAKGDVTKEFDDLAEQRILGYCAQSVPEPVRILTEERGEVRTRSGPARWTLIVDPVDGSENFARGNEDSSVSIAVVPGDGEPRPEAVQFALVGGIFSGTIYEAEQGEGTWRNGQPLRPSGCTRLREALVAIDFHARGAAVAARLRPLLETIKDARRFGTAAKELAAVGYGGVDAYVDVRGTLTPENYMAAYLIVAQAGGVITDAAGGPLAPVASMAQGQTIVAAATPELHRDILAALS